MGLKLNEAIDKDTKEPVDMIVCLREELNNPNKKIYKIEGFLANKKVKKIALSQINGIERILVLFTKLKLNYIEYHAKED